MSSKDLQTKVVGCREGGDSGTVYSTSPQSFIIFSGIITLETFIECVDWLVHLVLCLNVLTTNCNLQKG